MEEGDTGQGLRERAVGKGQGGAVCVVTRIKLNKNILQSKIQAKVRFWSCAVFSTVGLNGDIYDYHRYNGPVNSIHTMKNNAVFEVQCAFSAEQPRYVRIRACLINHIDIVPFMYVHVYHQKSSLPSTPRLASPRLAKRYPYPSQCYAMQCRPLPNSKRKQASPPLPCHASIQPRPRKQS